MCLPTYSPTYFLTYLLSYLFTYILIYLPAYPYSYLPTYFLIYLAAYLFIYLCPYVLAACLPTYWLDPLLVAGSRKWDAGSSTASTSMSLCSIHPTWPTMITHDWLQTLRSVRQRKGVRSLLQHTRLQIWANYFAKYVWKLKNSFGSWNISILYNIVDIVVPSVI